MKLNYAKEYLLTSTLLLPPYSGGYTLSEKKIETLIKKSELRAEEIVRLIQEACPSSNSIER